MAPKIALLGMPEDVTRKILGYLDFLAILNLHKTCHDLRNFINDLRPPSLVYGIKIEMRPEEICLTLNFDRVYHEYEEMKNYTIRYTPYISGVLKTVLRYFDLHFLYPKHEKKRKTFKVFEAIRNSQQTEIKEYTLKCKNVEMTCQGEHEVLEIVPFFDPKALEVLKIDVGKQKARLELQELIYLEQWENSKEVVLTGCTSVPKRFQNFEKVEISIHVLTQDDVFGFKEILLQHPTQYLIHLHFQHYYSENELLEMMGAPVFETDVFESRKWKVWWLRAAEEKVVKLELHEDSLMMTKMK
ncbi:hypothetical protein GCK72_021379 [Caenorhabditis remanei]|uniref:F-box domain-containing protein n=1 Tax=Caenorhabditis remanei TaxID=31234 RepID=A0A6A5GJS7_CAERE|nr:hypothetical protein GCK72_021379 [Caenorhabditis remanei]KAF1754815.1 hypothetical protein GCK72_021379 [Caenorhabditis remanei]